MLNNTNSNTKIYIIFFIIWDFGYYSIILMHNCILLMISIIITIVYIINKSLLQVVNLSNTLDTDYTSLNNINYRPKIINYIWQNNTSITIS